MTLLGHMRKGLKSLVECKFAIHHQGDPVLIVTRASGVKSAPMAAPSRRS
jgi:hypothetical protein